MAVRRLIHVYDGADKRITAVEIKTQFGVYKRAISIICVLPMHE